MKIIINENERGFLFKNGTYCKMLMPGKHKIHEFLGETYALVCVTKPVEVANVDLTVLLKDKNFADSVVKIDIPDSFIAVHMEDSRITGVLKPGTYCFFNCCRTHTFKLVDISESEISDLNLQQLAAIPCSMYSKIEVPEGETGLLFIDRRYERELVSGTYYFWNNMQKITCQNIDLRSQQLDITGQEILTADKVSLRINFVCTYKITDAVKIISEIKDYKIQIYTMTQLALREYIGKFRFDELN